MFAQTSLGYRKVLPVGGFQWAYRDAAGNWSMQAEPADWSERDYFDAWFPWSEKVDQLRRDLNRYASEEVEQQPQLADNFYLIMPYDCSILIEDDEAPGITSYEPPPSDLYQKIASLRANPETVRTFANRYGLMDLDGALQKIPKAKAKNLVADFETRVEDREPRHFWMYAEPAKVWLTAFERMKWLLWYWKFSDNKDNEQKGYALENMKLSAFGKGTISYDIEIDPVTGVVGSQVLANSLIDTLEIQWRMSLAMGVRHQQCAECSNWLAIHPSAGRPEKEYCSKACKQRGFRKRQRPKIKRKTVR
jgi:hypothetical protein